MIKCSRPSSGRDEEAHGVAAAQGHRDEHSHEPETVWMKGDHLTQSAS